MLAESESEKLPERCAIKLAYDRAKAGADFHDADHGKGTKRFPQHGAAHSKLMRQLALGDQSLARTDGPVQQTVPQIREYLGEPGVSVLVLPRQPHRKGSH